MGASKPFVPPRATRGPEDESQATRTKASGTRLGVTPCGNTFHIRERISSQWEPQSGIMASGRQLLALCRAYIYIVFGMPSGCSFARRGSSSAGPRADARPVASPPPGTSTRPSDPRRHGNESVCPSRTSRMLQEERSRHSPHVHLRRRLGCPAVPRDPGQGNHLKQQGSVLLDRHLTKEGELGPG